MTTITHRLHVYQDRLKTETDPDRRAFFEREIDDMEAEIAKEKLLYEIGFYTPLVIETDCMQTIFGLMADGCLLSAEFVWSWRRFRWQWRAEFWFNEY